MLPQLKQCGRVARGFIGVALKDVDPDLQRSLHLATARGALVQDVTASSPGDRAGLRAVRPHHRGRRRGRGDERRADPARRRRWRPAPRSGWTSCATDAPVPVPVQLAERPGRNAESRDELDGASVEQSPGPRHATIRSA